MTLESYLLSLKAMRQALKCNPYDIRVCVNPAWHRKEWYRFAGQQYRCAICERLSKWVA